MQYTKYLLFFLLFLVISFGVWGKNDPYRDYIDKYNEMAVAQREAYGIPACITLAQGLLESAAGRSTLAVKGNNHFGIKCHNDWTGDTLLRNDDAAGECFRSYPTPLESFVDHSKFLRRKRYASLFDLSPTDYQGWARGLKSCGYATDPNYADRLIAIIEQYSLYKYDGVEDDGLSTADFIFQQMKNAHLMRRYRGLYYVMSVPGDTYSSIAKELEMDPSRLMAYNDVAEDREVMPWQEVYLQPKLDYAPKEMTSITIGEEDCIFSIAQRLGMTLDALRKLNPKAADIPGTTLKLR
jgi:hypothetical protein